MSNKFRNVLGVIVTATLLAVSATASAGVVDKAASKLRDQKSEQRSDQKSDKNSDKGSAPHSEQGRNAQPQRDDRVRGNAGDQSPPPRSGGRDSRDDNGNRNGDGDRERGPGSNPTPNQGQGSSRDLRDDLDRLYGNRGSDRDRDHDGNHGGNGNHDGHNHRPPRVVERLPPGYRNYYWNDSHYYVYGGHWYRPYGSSFITVGIPFGLFVATLPGLYTSTWVDGTRYYYADSTYYVYEPVRRGYVVTRSPYGDDENDYDEDYGDDLYIYPARGQSEQLQADDRYQCHRWAADQSHYDPLDDEYNSDKRADYRRAMTACLTGRGYTVN